MLVAAAATLVAGLTAGGTTLLFVASGLALAAIALVGFDAWAFGHRRGQSRPETQEPETTEPETTEPETTEPETAGTVEQDEVFDER
jgi:hypothetical protein